MERGRFARSAAMEWREVVQTVPGALLCVGTRTAAPDLIELAHRKLAVRVGVLDRLRAGAVLGEMDLAEIHPTPQGVCPVVKILEEARHAVAHETALHAKAGHVLVLYGRAHPGLLGTPRWLRWCHHHGHATQRAEQALRRLRLAVAHAEASADAVRVADWSPPRLGPRWTAWTSAAVQLARLAMDDAKVALEEVRRMRQAAMSEYFNGSTPG